METNNNSNTDFNDNDIQSNTDAPVATTELVHEAKENMALSSGKCGACQRTGFPLFLVRKSVVPKFFKNSEANIWETGMLPLKNHEPTTSFKHFSYVYRTLREGYVYILLQKNKSAKGWKGTNLNLLKVKVFEVTKSGAFRLREFRDVKGTRPKELPENCVLDGHQFKAKFITLDNKIYDKAWIAYSPYRWDKEVVDHYRKNKKDRDNRFTVVDLTQTVPSLLTDKGERSFSFSDFTRVPIKSTPFVEGEEQVKVTKRYLLEMECNKHEVLDYFNNKQLDDRRQKSIEEQIEAQKNASKNGNSQAQTQSPSIGIKDTKLNKEIAKGSFYAQNYDLKNQLENTESSIIENYRKIFCSASQFNTLKKDVGGLNNDFVKTIDGYKGEAYDNSNYKTSEIGVIIVEDSLGIAEELAVQRRQLLAPVIDGLAGNSQEQIIAIQKRLQSNLGKTVNQIILEEKDEIDDEIDPSIIQSFYSENLIDLEYNKRYKNVHRLPDYLRLKFPPADWLETTINTFDAHFTSYLFSSRKKAIEEYFDKQKSDAYKKPLLYFKPETSYARNQYNSIESYKQILNDQMESPTECVLFGFHRKVPPQGTLPDLIDVRERNQANSQAKTKLSPGNQPGMGKDHEKALDPLIIVDVVGEQEFCIENQLNYHGPTYQNALSMVGRYYYFRLVKEKGFSRTGVTNPPLGDYEVIELTDEQKQQIFAIYKQKPDALNLNMIKHDVVAVKFPNAKENVAKWNKDKQWKKKADKHINADSLNKYEQLNKQLHKNLTDYVKNVSQDYFTYLIWLFGENNPTQFWLKECDPDTSDRHINALTSLLMILDTDFNGSFYLEQQSELWTKLINYENSIYHHFIEGNKYSLFNVASGNVDEADRQLTEDVKEILANQNSGADNRSTKINNPLSKVNSAVKYVQAISNLKIKENVTIAAYVKEELIKLSMSNIAKTLANKDIYNLEKEITNKHLVKALNMYSTGVHQQYKLKVSVRDIPNFIDNLGESAPIVFSKENNLITTGGKTIRSDYSATSKKFTLNAFDLTQAKRDYVEFDMIITFDSEQKRCAFNDRISNLRGKAKVKQFYDITLVEESELFIAEYQKEKKIRQQVYDTSLSGAINVLSLAFQYLQITSLEKRLEELGDSALIDKLSKSLHRAHFDLVLTLSDTILSGIKLAALFTARNDNLAKILSALGQASKAIGGIAKVVNLIDSFGDLCRAFNAIKRGDTNALSYLLTSTIGFVAAGIGLFFAISGPWCIVLLLAPMIINFLFGSYDDGTEWDEMEKWLNRSIFGNFNRNDLYPPYPISDTGNYLSEQDFYLASRKGFCRTAHYVVKLQDLDKEAKNKKSNNANRKKLPIVNWGTDDQREIIEQINASKDRKKHNLHLVMQLPDFKENTSTFEGKVIIRHRKAELITVLNVSHGEESLVIKEEKANPDYFQLLDDSMTRNKNLEHYRYFKVDANDKLKYWLDMQQKVEPTPAKKTDDKSFVEKENTKLEDILNNSPNKRPTIGLFLINQMLGRVIGEFEAICSIQYFPKGKTDSYGKPQYPYLLTYQFEAVTWFESYWKEVSEAGKTE